MKNPKVERPCHQACSSSFIPALGSNAVLNPITHRGSQLKAHFSLFSFNEDSNLFIKWPQCHVWKVPQKTKCSLGNKEPDF